MRVLILALTSLLLAACASNPRQSLQSVEINEIKPRYIEAGDFVRISEYFSGQEDPGNRLILRSQPESREGYYFTLVLDQPVRRLPKGTQIITEFYDASQVEPRRLEFTVPSRRPKTREIFVGLTGTDWPDPDAVPSAWRFVLMDANGKTLGSSQSFLWAP